MKHKMGRNWDLMILGAMGILVITIFAGFIFSDKMFFGSDMIPMGYMMRQVVVDSWKAQGTIPVWDQYILGGLPVVDAMHGDLFYPASVLYLLMPLHKALGYKIILHVWLAGTVMYFLLRTLGLRRRSSTVGALGYMTAPYFLSLIYAGHDAKMFVTALFPLCVLLLERLLRKPGLLHSALFGGSIGLLLLTSHPQMAYFAGWGLGIYLVCGLARRDSRNNLAPRIGFTALAVVVGVAIGCVQFLPTYYYTTHFSPRTGGVSLEYATSWSLHPEEIVSLMYPSFVGYLGDYWGRNPFKLNAESPGPLILLLALGGFVLLLRNRRMLPWLILFIFCPLYALGAHTPVFKAVFYGVPVARFLRAPSLIMFMFSCSAGVLGAFFVDAFFDEKTPPFRKKVLTWLLVLAVVLTLLFTVARGALYEAWGGIFRGLEKGNLETARSTARGLNLDAALVLIFGGGLLVLMQSKYRLKWGGGLVIGVALAGVLATSLPHSLKFVKYLRVGDFVRSDPMIEYVKKDTSIYRVLPLTGTAYDRDYLPLFGLETATGFYDNRIRFYDDLVGEGFRNLLNSNIMRVANVKYVLTTRRLDLPMLSLEKDLGSAFVYRNREFLPRAYVVHRATVAESDSAAVDIMKRASFDPASEIVLAAGAPSGVPLSGETPSVDETVTIQEYSPGRIAMAVATGSAGYLCYSGNWLPYWEAYVDGRKTDVLRCNVAMRAVPLGPGEHRVEMRYRSRWYRIGAYLCLASCAFVGLSVLVCLKRAPAARKRG
jgi:hypothetical protein